MRMMDVRSYATTFIYILYNLPTNQARELFAMRLKFVPRRIDWFWECDG